MNQENIELEKPTGDLTGKILYCPTKRLYSESVEYPNVYLITRKGDKSDDVYWCKAMIYKNGETAFAPWFWSYGEEMLFTEADEDIQNLHFVISEEKFIEISKAHFGME